MTYRARHMPPRHALRLLSAVLLALMPLGTGACSKPISFQLIDTEYGAPLEAVRIHRHSVSIFTPLPRKRAPLATDFNGGAIVPIPPNPTALTFLRQGYEPLSIGIFRQVPSSLLAPAEGSEGSACDIPPLDDEDPCSAWQRILIWDDLVPKVPVTVRMRPLRSEPVDVLVVDESGAPLPGCEVFGATFLFLPIPGVEPEWGFPSLQREVTDHRGQASLVTWSGFRNRITARMPERGEAHADVDGAQAMSVRLMPRNIQWRSQRIRVVDPKRRPIAGARVSYGEIRNGLPVGPNAFVVETDQNGETPEVLLPDDHPLHLRIRAKGYKDRVSAPLWRSLEEGGTWRVVLERR